MACCCGRACSVRSHVHWGARRDLAIAVVLVGIVFGLAHFEALQLIALAGFGILLGALATATGRLGPGIVTHASFNAVTFDLAGADPSLSRASDGLAPGGDE